MIQFLYLGVLAGLFWWLVSNAATNLKNQGIASGFGFLSARAGFSMIQSLIEFSGESTYGRAFFAGLLNTIMISGIGLFLSTILGFFIGISRLSSNWLLRSSAAIYIESVRNIPLLLQIFFWYFVVLRALPGPKESYSIADLIFLNNRGLMTPTMDAGTLSGLSLCILSGIILSFFIYALFIKYFPQNRSLSFKFIIFLGPPGLITIGYLIANYPDIQLSIPALSGFNFTGGLTIIPEMSALVLALSIYTASFIGEIVRAGIQSVSKGQLEAAKALGFNQTQTLRLIIIPQAMRVIIPPLTSQYLNLTKNSSLGAAIGYPELVSVFAGTVLNQTGQAVEVVGITMTVYLSLSLSISLFMNWFNKYQALKGTR